MEIIKIMPEYGMYPLWIEKSKMEPFESIAIEDLKLSTSLMDKIKDWDNKFQNTYNENYPQNSGFKSQREKSLFEDNGIKIWKELQSELTNEIKVVYYSVLENKLYENLIDLK